jgi:RNA polymerase sigma-70 factor (ECF subfamily)
MDDSLTPLHTVSEPTGSDATEADARAAHLADLRAGCETAFRAVYEAEKGCVYGLLLRLTANPALTADLFQNVWLKLAKHHRQLRPDTNLRAWLCTVARNEWLSQRRAERVDMSRIFTFGLQQTAQHVDAFMAESLDVLNALNRLSDADREVLVLSSVTQLASEQVAAALELNSAALRQRLSRARQRLQQELERAEAAEKTLAGLL